MKNAFIVLEGIDGSGKTTMGKILASKIGGVFYQTPSSFWRKHRSIVENSHCLIRFLFYLSATIYSSIEIRILLKKTPVVCDRYIYSTWAHHYAYGLKILKKISYKYLPITKPDKVIYLYVDLKEREKRIKQRRNNTKKDEDSETLQIADDFFMGMKEIIKINCTCLTKKEVIGKIFEKL